jgi:hypothetical protein
MTFTAKLAKLARHGFEVRDGVGYFARHDAQL